MVKKLIFLFAFLASVGFALWLLQGMPGEQLAKQVAVETHAELETHAEPACYTLGFQNLQAEINEPASVEGVFPEWLEGNLFFTGPGRFEINNTFATHWSEGHALIHRWSFKNGTVTYANKFIENEVAQKAVERGSMEEPKKKKSWLSGLASALFSDAPIYDNTNMNVIKIGDEFIAVSESAHTNSFDPCSLQTHGHTDYDDELDCHYVCAHPIFDKEHNRWISYGTTFGTRCYYKVFTFKPDSKKRKVLTTIKVKKPAYMHSFCATKNYIILVESPFRVSPYDLISANGAFIECFKWNPSEKTNFIVIDRNTHTVIKTLKANPFFFFHQVNAFEENGIIVLDLVTYEDPSIIKSYTLKKIFNAECPFDDTQIVRFTLDLKANEVTETVLQNKTAKVPTINKHYCMQPYRYVWATGTDNSYEYTNQLKKVDLQNKREHVWQEDHCYTRDPIFVPKPNGVLEDEGVVLSVVLDAKKKQTFLLALDAHSFKEIGRATIAHPIPFSLHGDFFQTKRIS